MGPRVNTPRSSAREVGSLRPLPRATTGPGPIRLRVQLEAPTGFGFAPGSQASVRVVPQAPLPGIGRHRLFPVADERPSVEFMLEDGPPPTEAAVELHVAAVVCSKAGPAACWPLTAAYRLPVRISAEAEPRAVEVPLPLPAPE